MFRREFAGGLTFCFLGEVIARAASIEFGSDIGNVVPITSFVVVLLRIKFKGKLNQ